jgi:hypothetical protein
VTEVLSILVAFGVLSLFGAILIGSLRTVGGKPLDERSQEFVRVLSPCFAVESVLSLTAAVLFWRRVRLGWWLAIAAIFFVGCWFLMAVVAAIAVGHPAGAIPAGIVGAITFRVFAYLWDPAVRARMSK